MFHSGILGSFTGLPAVALAVAGSAAVAGGAFWVARRLNLADRLMPCYATPPAPADRVRQLVACAEYSAGYGPSALPDFPPCARDAVLARAARLAADIPNPDELDAALDTDLHSWLAVCAKRSTVLRRVESLIPAGGAVGLSIGLLGVGAIAGGWFPIGTAGALVVLSAVLLGLVATALGSARADHQAFADPATVLDRQLISAAMIGLRRSKTPGEIHELLSGFLPQVHRADSESHARAA